MIPSLARAYFYQLHLKAREHTFHHCFLLQAPTHAHQQHDAVYQSMSLVTISWEIVELLKPSNFFFYIAWITCLEFFCIIFTALWTVPEMVLYRRTPAQQVFISFSLCSLKKTKMLYAKMWAKWIWRPCIMFWLWLCAAHTNLQRWLFWWLTSLHATHYFGEQYHGISQLVLQKYEVLKQLTQALTLNELNDHYLLLNIPLNVTV